MKGVKSINYLFLFNTSNIDKFPTGMIYMSLKIPSKLKDNIERIILKILYDEKSVRTLKILTEIALERAVKEKITVSEKIIAIIINKMNKEGKIQFFQRDGWKIRI